jgi:O-antigen ligase/polysaccharide polymerase Wzy-like membrane protein
MRPDGTLVRDRGHSNGRIEDWPSRVDSAPRRAAPPPDRTDDWPHTKRLMPWLLAGFMAMVFLIPIDGTELKVHLPVDSKPDRFVIGAMLAVLVVKALLPKTGERPARRRMTVVTAAVLIFGAFVLFSLLLNVDRIYQLGQLTFAEKALSQVLAYIGFFLIVATQVRKSEVAAYGRLVLGLAVITALGTLYESRTGFNVFYILGGDLLRPIATVIPSPTNINPTFLEGRKIIVGPTKHGLALASMLSIALPFAVIKLQEAKTRQKKSWYLLIICLLLAASLSTGRKTAIIAPIAVFAVLAFYNRRMLRWTPLALLVLIPVIHFASPGALGTFNVLAGAGSSDSTTQRVTDYSGITPDVLSHPIFGQGYGSLDSDNTRWYRILDNEYLDELFQVGILGVLAYLAMVLAPLITAHGVIKRAGGRAPPIIAAAAGCAAYAVVSATFDAMSFPQAPYAFFFMAGLIAAAATARDDDAAQAPALRLENLRRRVRHRGRQRVGATA